MVLFFKMASFESDLNVVTNNLANVTIGDVIDRVSDNRDNLLLLIKERIVSVVTHSETIFYC